MPRRWQVICFPSTTTGSNREGSTLSDLKRCCCCCCCFGWGGGYNSLIMLTSCRKWVTASTQQHFHLSPDFSSSHSGLPSLPPCCGSCSSWSGSWWWRWKRWEQEWFGGQMGLTRVMSDYFLMQYYIILCQMHHRASNRTHSAKHCQSENSLGNWIIWIAWNEDFLPAKNCKHLFGVGHIID